jgi:hypothetical protein
MIYDAILANRLTAEQKEMARVTSSPSLFVTDGNNPRRAASKLDFREKPAIVESESLNVMQLPAPMFKVPTRIEQRLQILLVKELEFLF